MPSKEQDEDVAPNPRRIDQTRTGSSQRKTPELNVPALTFVGQHPVPVFDIWDDDVFNPSTDEDANGDGEAFKSKLGNC